MICVLQGYEIEGFGYLAELILMLSLQIFITEEEDAGPETTSGTVGICEFILFWGGLIGCGEVLELAKKESGEI